MTRTAMTTPHGSRWWVIADGDDITIQVERRDEEPVVFLLPREDPAQWLSDLFDLARREMAKTS